jgi:hypothetical protein
MQIEQKKHLNSFNLLVGLVIKILFVFNVLNK